jgi:hypothetical protein
VITGRIQAFRPGSDVLNLIMTISGPLSNLTINGTLGGNSTIEAIGPNGTIGNVTVKRDVIGTIHATESIKNVTINGNLTGTLKVDALNRSGVALSKLTVGGTISNGSLIVGAPDNIASVGTITVGGNLGGSAADQMNISGGVQKLLVRGVMNLTANVGGTLGTLQTTQVNGPVTVGGDLQNLLVTGAQGVGVTAPISVVGQFRSATIGGNVTADLSGTGGIGTVTINGDFAAGHSITSANGSIGTVTVNGNLLGSVRADGGQINALTVSGNVGDGATALLIASGLLNVFTVGGSIRSGVTVRISGPINALVVGQNIEAGATIIATAIGKQTIGGQVFGTLLIG